MSVLKNLLRPTDYVWAVWPMRADQPGEVGSRLVAMLSAVRELVVPEAETGWREDASRGEVLVTDFEAVRAVIDRSPMPGDDGTPYDDWFIPELRWVGEAEDPSTVDVRVSFRTDVVPSGQMPNDSATLNVQGASARSRVQENRLELVRRCVDIWDPAVATVHDTALARAGSAAGLPPQYSPAAYVAWLADDLLPDADPIPGAERQSYRAGTLVMVAPEDPAKVADVWRGLIDSGRLRPIAD